MYSKPIDGNVLKLSKIKILVKYRNFWLKIPALGNNPNFGQKSKFWLLIKKFG